METSLSTNRETLRLHVDSEVGTLRCLLVHTPDQGIGRILPSKAQDWLFDDIVHLDTMQREYDTYTRLLLYFLDPERLRHAPTDGGRTFYTPGHPHFHGSAKVIELEHLLLEILEKDAVRLKLVSAACALERTSYDTQERLLRLPSADLAHTLIAGALPSEEMVFAPIPNFIFTRDIGVVVNGHVLLNKPARLARTRESMIAKFIFFNHPLFARYHDRIIEIEHDHHFFLVPESEHDIRRVTLEGGDVMTVSDEHLVIGISERTTAMAVRQVIRALFARGIVSKVTAVAIPAKRDYMHIDTIFTQVSRDTWVMHGSLGRANHAADGVFNSLLGRNPNEQVRILQYQRGREETPYTFDYLEDLFEDISRNDLHVNGPVRFIYSGQNEFPFGAREQWTDACNLLALREGVVVGYDRNDRTAENFRRAGFDVVHVRDLLAAFERGDRTPDEVENTLITLPSAELSRARGGSHCMSMPLWRDSLAFG